MKIIEKGENADILYLDFSKAFDKVDVGLLSHRLKQMGISGQVGKWLIDFLTDRVQNVVANGKKGPDSIVRSGVSQGTILGPILFLIIIQSLDDLELSSVIASFADDTKVLRKVNSLEDVEDMQADLDKLYEWETQNNMLFNISKFKWLQLGKNTVLKNEYCYMSEHRLPNSPI